MALLDRKVLRDRMRSIMADRRLALQESVVELDAACDEMIDAVLDATAHAAVSKGMEFARGLLAKRGGKDSGE